METILPAILALLSAASWGFNAHIQRLGLDDTDALTGAFISVATGTLLCWIAAPFLVDPAWWGTRGMWIFVVVGLLVPALGQRFQIASVGLVGAALTASIAAFAPVFSISFGVVILGETPSGQAAFGVALMIIGLVLATWSPRGVKRGFPLWAILVPLGAALVRGITQPGIKLGMEDVPSPFFALLISGSVSTVVLGAMLALAHARGRTTYGRGMRWFAVNGVINTAGLFGLNVALSLGALTIVSPLAATVPLWALFFGFLVFRRETLGPKHLAIALLVVAGAALALTA